jgi:hypothetical protein
MDVKRFGDQAVVLAGEEQVDRPLLRDREL